MRYDAIKTHEHLQFAKWLKASLIIDEKEEMYGIILTLCKVVIFMRLGCIIFLNFFDHITMLLIR